MFESVRPSAKDLLGKDGHDVADPLRAVTTDGNSTQLSHPRTRGSKAAGRRHGAQAPQA